MLPDLMCLAVPVQIVTVTESARGQFGRSGTVDLHGSRTEVSLALVPKATVGSWVLIHAGMAIQEVNEAEARETWRWLTEAGILPLPPSGPAEA
jgi:hydrogenase expression/formation protein HypC